MCVPWPRLLYHLQAQFTSQHQILELTNRTNRRWCRSSCRRGSRRALCLAASARSGLTRRRRRRSARPTLVRYKHASVVLAWSGGRRVVEARGRREITFPAVWPLGSCPPSCPLVFVRVALERIHGHKMLPVWHWMPSVGRVRGWMGVRCHFSSWRSPPFLFFVPSSHISSRLSR